MNYLQLAQRLRQEMHDTGEGPHQVTNQRGRSLEYVNAIQEAWLDIQQLRPWNAKFWGREEGEGEAEAVGVEVEVEVEDKKEEGFSPEQPQVLTRSADTPFIPERYHLAIVFYALSYKAISHNTQELMLRGQQEWDKYLHLLCRDFLPNPTIAMG